MEGKTMQILNSFIRDTVHMEPKDALKKAEETLELLDAEATTAKRVRRAVVALAECWRCHES